MRVVKTLLRWVLGLLFIWPFVDKLFGLGYATAAESAWIRGGSPTMGFLQFGASGPFSVFFNSIGGNGITDWLFMLCLLIVGIALILGIGLRIAAISGALLMFMMWAAVLPKEHNFLLMDEHLVYMFLLLVIGFDFAEEDQWAGLGNWWRSTKLVQKAPFLK
jgi:thiosulfate dehydrogenase [quinone] large subunit